MRIRLRNAEVEGLRADVTVEGATVALVDGEYVHEDTTIDAAGGAVIPGLHDHHLHLLAMAARSVDLRTVGTLDELQATLRATRQVWVRATGYHESIGGHLDRHVLDRLVPDRPARVQHRSGALWMLNTAALDQVRAGLDDSVDVERDEAGEPNGRLWRYDSRLRAASGLGGVKAELDVGEVGDRLLRLGITGVTDATPDLDSEAISLLSDARRDRLLPQEVILLGVPDDWRPVGDERSGLTGGPAKLLLRDHDLPHVSTIAGWVRRRRLSGRAVAIHVVTSEALALVVAALDEVGTHVGDRIEHASVVPPALREDLARLRLRVVTQPDFVRSRGRQYLDDLEPFDLGFLYPYHSLISCGVAVAPSSDAPFGDVDPWRIIRSAARRTTSAGGVLGQGERVPAAIALSGYLSDPLEPGGAARSIVHGASGSVCLLRRPLAEVLRDPDRDLVRVVTVGGRISR